MRVLFITGEFPPMQGGVGDCTHEIARALAEQGEQVEVLTSSRAEGVTVVNHTTARTKAAGPGGDEDNKPFRVLPFIPKWDWSCLRTITRAAREFATDVVHIQYQTGAFGMHPAIDFLPRYFRSPAGDVARAPRRGLRPRPRVITTFHDLRVPYLFPKAGPVREWVTRQLARASDAVVATNDEDYSRLVTFDLPLLKLIPIGSNLSTKPPADYRRAQWRTRLGVGEEETLLCYFGFLNESKGGETLVRALALVPRAKLLMIGGQIGASDPTNAAYLAKVKALISDLGLSDRVSWTDYTPPEIVTANFLASDLCVLPYRDGASYRRGTLMAALAHGAAIVTTTARPVKTRPTAQLPRLCDGENCLLVPPDDPETLAAAITRAMASPDLRKTIGEGARRLAMHFTWEAIARQHLELYRQLGV